MKDPNNPGGLPFRVLWAKDDSNDKPKNLIP